MTKQEKSISAVILAGGKATRYGGRNKAFIQVDGLTIFERNLKVLRDLFSEILLITNEPASYDFVSDVKIYTDVIAGKGPLSGIHSGLKHISGEAAFIFACDMPNLDKDVISQQIDAYWRKPERIQIPVSGRGQEPLHAVYPKAAFHEVERILLQHKNPRIRLLYSHYPTLFRKFDNIALANHVFMNINSPGDLNAMKF
jgi:molybdopterin-guanine dinucleotide biosynthesis protein A